MKRGGSNETRRVIGGLSLVACTVLAGNGCTLWGLAIGTGIDADRSKIGPTQTWRIATLPAGTPVVLQLADGRRVEGALDGTRFREPAEYRPLYESARASDDRLPELGPCTLLDVDGSRHAVDLLGLDPQGVVIRAEGGQTRFPFDRLGALRDAHGRVASGPELKRFAQRGVPLASMVLLRGVSDALPVDQIEQVEAPRPPKHRGKLIGTVAGLLVDGFLVALLYPRGYEDPIACGQAPKHETCGAVERGEVGPRGLAAPGGHR